MFAKIGVLFASVATALSLSLGAATFGRTDQNLVNSIVAERAQLPQQLVEAFNQQIKSELDGAHLYLAVSSYLYEQNLDGFGHWFGQQYYEELNHARIMMDYLKRKNAQVLLKEIEAPQSLHGLSAEAIFDLGLTTEEEQSQKIFTLHDASVSSGARDAATLLQWFIDEQVEEEDNFRTFLEKIRLVKDSPEGILLIDKDLAARLPAIVWNPGQPLPPH